MGHIRLGAAVSAGTVLSVGLSACSPGSGTSSNSVSPESGATPRPESPAGPPTWGLLPGHSKGGSAGRPPPGARVANLPIAKTIATSDTSSSVVIDGSGPAITCGKTPVTTYRDVLYDTPTSGGKPVPLKLDVQVPKGAGKKPLVVFITGGGFVLAHKPT